MNKPGLSAAVVLGLCVFFGLASLGYLLGSSLLRFKAYERSVVVKGLSEREFPADVAIWPIQINRAENDLGRLYQALDNDVAKIRDFLLSSGFDAGEITVTPPSITDKVAQQYGGSDRIELRFTGRQTVTVYSKRVDRVRQTQSNLATLGKQGIVFSGEDYGIASQYLFTRLNEVKPEMIEEATRKAREVAEKFARDSHSHLGKIKHARQGQFSVENRDLNTPYIKKVRVVSTIEYYLSD